jgi:hypothetical protein
MEAACEAAAAAVGKPYNGTEVQTLRPRGCYLNTAVGSVYLNIHPTGGAAPDTRPLCIGTGAPFQPPPPAHLRATPWAETPVQGEYRGSAPVPGEYSLSTEYFE